MARESRAKRARTAANGGEGGAQAAELGASQGAASSNAASASSAAGAGNSASGSISSGMAAPIASVAAAIAAGGSPLDALPDELLGRVLFEAARRDWRWLPPCRSFFDPEDDQPDVQPDRLVKLKAVCRRFRRIVDDGSLWGRAALSDLDDAEVEALTKLPEKARKAVRRIVLNCSTVSFDGFFKFVAAFRDQLEDFGVYFAEIDIDASKPAAPSIAAISSMQRLRSLYIGMVPFESPATTAVQQSLSLLSLLPNLKMLDLMVPVPVTVLRALAPLAPSLQALQFHAFLGTNQPPLEIFEAAAKFAALEMLGLSFRSADTGAWLQTDCKVDDLRPLCNLTRVRDLDLECHLGWIGFISQMPLLQRFFANITDQAEVDLAPLSSATKLTALCLDYDIGASSADRAIKIAVALSSCPSLQVANLTFPPAVFEALAGRSLAAWTRLESLVIELRGDGSVIPGSFLKRLASDVPNLRVLEVKSLLPVLTDLLSIGSLKHIRKLRLSGEAARATDRPERQLITGSLMGVRVSFDVDE
eukprot:tig00020960_g16529.t2